jgi:hypothetical protein
MSDGRDVAGALRKVAALIEDYNFPGPSVPRPIKDENGSQVGTWAITEGEDQ